MTLRSIVKHSFAYSVSVVLSKVASVLLTPIYTRYLSPADYGVIELLDLTTFAVSLLAGYYLADAFLYQYSNAPEADRERVLSTAFFGAMGVGLAVFLGIWVSAPLVSELVFGTNRYAFYFQLVFFNFILAFPAEVAGSHMRFLNRSTLLMKGQLIRLVLAVTFNIGLLTIWRLGISSVLCGGLIATAFAAVYTGYFSIGRIPWKWDWRIFREMFRYALPLGISGLAMMCVNYGDRFFLKRVASLSEIGIYSLAYKIGMLVAYVQVIFNMFWSSQMFTVLRAPEGQGLYIRLSTYLAAAVMYTGLMLCILVRPIVRGLSTAQFGPAAEFVPAIVLAYAIKCLAEHFRSIIFVEKRTDIEMRVTFLGAGICLLGYAVLVPRFRFWGAIGTTVGAFAIMGVYGLWEAQRLRRCAFEWRRLGLIAVTVAIISGVHLALDLRSLPWQLLWSCVATVLYLGLLWIFGFLHADEAQAINSAVRGMFLRRAAEQANAAKL